MESALVAVSGTPVGACDERVGECYSLYCLFHLKNAEDVISKGLEGILLEDGEDSDQAWLKDHPWAHEKPKPGEDMPTTVDASKEHYIDGKWRTMRGDKEKLNLREIYDHLPTFLLEMNSERKEQAVPTKPTSDKPHRPKGDESLKAFSLPKNKHQHTTHPFYLSCEAHLMPMHLPPKVAPLFDVTIQGNWRRIEGLHKEIAPKQKRWVFIPSYRQADIALLDWPDKDDDELALDKTYRFIIVRPAEFGKYVSMCGESYHVIALPDNENGVGYARYWIQKVALRLGLDFIWMMDDSLECFYLYNPKKEYLELVYTTQVNSAFRAI